MLLASWFYIIQQKLHFDILNRFKVMGVVHSWGTPSIFVSSHFFFFYVCRYFFYFLVHKMSENKFYCFLFIIDKNNFPKHPQMFPCPFMFTILSPKEKIPIGAKIPLSGNTDSRCFGNPRWNERAISSQTASTYVHQKIQRLHILLVNNILNK